MTRRTEHLLSLGYYSSLRFPFNTKCDDDLQHDIMEDLIGERQSCSTSHTKVFPFYFLSAPPGIKRINKIMLMKHHPFAQSLELFPLSDTYFVLATSVGRR